MLHVERFRLLPRHGRLFQQLLISCTLCPSADWSDLYEALAARRFSSSVFVVRLRLFAVSNVYFIKLLQHHQNKFLTSTFRWLICGLYQDLLPVSDVSSK